MPQTLSECSLPRVMLPTAQGGREYFYPHFTDEQNRGLRRLTDFLRGRGRTKMKACLTGAQAFST